MVYSYYDELLSGDDNSNCAPPSSQKPSPKSLTTPLKSLKPIAAQQQQQQEETTKKFRKNCIFGQRLSSIRKNKKQQQHTSNDKNNDNDRHLFPSPSSSSSNNTRNDVISITRNVVGNNNNNNNNNNEENKESKVAVVVDDEKNKKSEAAVICYNGKQTSSSPKSVAADAFIVQVVPVSAQKMIHKSTTEMMVLVEDATKKVTEEMKVMLQFSSNRSIELIDSSTTVGCELMTNVDLNTCNTIQETFTANNSNSPFNNVCDEIELFIHEHYDMFINIMYSNNSNNNKSKSNNNNQRTTTTTSNNNNICAAAMTASSSSSTYDPTMKIPTINVTLLA